MDLQSEGYSHWFLVLVVLIALVAFFFPFAAAATSAPDQSPWVSYAVDTDLAPATAILLPQVELRRPWQGFLLVASDDVVTPLHFEVLANGQLGWGPQWLAQRPLDFAPDLIVVRLAAASDLEALKYLRGQLAAAGMMAPDAPWQKDQR